MMKKRILFAVMLLFVLCLASFCVFASENILKPPSEISFTYTSDYKNYKGTCYYTDNYFNESSYTYNNSLSTMSLCLSMSAFNSADGGSKNYSDKSANVRDLLKKTGIKNDDIAVNDFYKKKPENDSIGVICGHKPIVTKDGKFELVAVAIRGGGYEKEWASNFTLGKSGDHKGFTEAKNKTLDFIKKFIKDEKLNGKIKIWITGFSRAGAVANLVAGTLVDKQDLGKNVSFKAEDVYAYTFEAPAGTLKNNTSDKKYNNIFNIINPNDIVPLVGPKKWNFARYGTDVVLSEKPKKEVLDIYKKMPSIIDLAKEKSAESGEKVTPDDMYMIDDFAMYEVDLKFLLPGGEIPIQPDEDNKHITQKKFINSFIDVAADDFFGSRTNYTNKFQNDIRELFSLFAGLGPEQSEKVTEYLMNQFSKKSSILFVKYIWQAQLNPWGSEEKVYEEICTWIHDAMKSAGVKNYDKKAIDKAGVNLADYLTAFAFSNPEYTLSAIMNASAIGSAHYPELCFAYLSCDDKNYRKDAPFKFSDSSRRLIGIEGNADVSVYNSKGKLEAQISGGKPVYTKEIIHKFGIDKNGNRVVYLPFEKEYKIKIIPVSDEKISLSISEITSKGKVTRRIDYFDLAVYEDNEISIPSVSKDKLKNLSTEGTKAEYKVSLSNGVTAKPFSDRRGKNAEITTLNLKINSVDAEKGVVSGAGKYKYGEYVTLKAEESKNYAFSGWKTGDSLLSKEHEYSFRISDNMNVDAIFECRHLDVKIVNAVTATCETAGNSGDTVCLVCKQTILKGIEIMPLGHTYMDYECERCKKLDPSTGGNPNAGNVNLGIALSFVVLTAAYKCIVVIVKRRRK